LRRKTFPDGAVLMSADQPGEVVYIILEGALKVYVDQTDGTEVIIALLGSGDLVGEMSILDNTGHCANVATLEDSTLLWVTRSIFQQWLRSSNELCFNLMHILAARLRFADEQIQWLSALEVERRVARQLLTLADRLGSPTAEGGAQISIRLTQTDIAGLVGATREHVNKIISSYKTRRYISVDHRHRITILNHKALLSRC